MTPAGSALDFILHVDRYLGELARSYGLVVYPVLFVVVFCETGLVVTPFLPGDSLLFAAGALAGAGQLSLGWSLFAFWLAAVLGDTANYAIGRHLGPAVLRRPDSRILKPEYIDRTRRFFEKYGGKTIVLGRFVPIVRTFAPFMAGVGCMTYRRFIVFNVVGATAWVGVFLFAGYFFGRVPLVKDNFSIAVLVVVAISLLPAAYEFVVARRGSRRAKASGTR